ncbi:spore germination protein (amino acid permease) [Bacillus thermophilus]|uniref:Spore germination protein (Amino acid permease) n=1 Tax=Siminovitchia thermophila TaxID=1245522 RepID=A0ABS2RAW2_9BACI|nr:endospore germination permease [Siminovitchia thermophila]MBM7716314.1 spore germination protein (amino acid permease) [Siminovitchia thermophila]ONK24195.1 hypothetical protein BLX87_06885 [Bacillus sp. VT-16-64]
MKEKDTITNLQFIFLCMTAIGLHNHVIMITPLIQTAGRDSWISAVVAAALTIIWGFLLFYIIKTTNQEHLYTWLKKRIGKPFAVALGGIIYLYFIFLGMITLRETITWTKITYLQNTPSWSLTILIITLCVLAACTSLRTISIANIFILAFVVVFGFFVAFANIKVKDYSLLKPLLEHGFEPVVKGMVYPGSGFAEIILLIFLQHKFAEQARYRNIVLLVIVLFFLTVGPLIGGIIEFGPKEAANQRFTAFEEWGLVSIGRYVEHLDFLSIYQWLSGAFIRITLMFVTAIEIFRFKTKKLKVIVLLVIAGLTTIVSLIPVRDDLHYQLLKSVFMPLSLYFYLTISIIISLIIFFVKRKEKRRKSV